MVFSLFSTKQIWVLFLITSRNAVSIKYLIEVNHTQLNTSVVWWESSANTAFASLSCLFSHPPCFDQSSTYEHQTAMTSGPVLQLDVLSKQTAFKNEASRIFLGFRFGVHISYVDTRPVDPRCYCNTNNKETLNFADYCINR